MGNPQRTTLRRLADRWLGPAVPLLLFLALALAPNADAADCPVTAYDAKTDYFPQKVYPEYNNLYNVTYGLSYKIVYSKMFGRTYVLYMCNTPRQVPGVNYPSDAKYFSVPVTSIGIADFETFGYMERLGLYPLVRAVPVPTNIASSCLASLYSQGRLQALSDTAASVASVDVIFSGYSNQVSFTVPEADAKLVKTNPQIDTSPIGRLEWLEFFAYWANTESAATKLFSQALAQYQCSQQYVANAKLNASYSPKIMWAWQRSVGDDGWDTYNVGWRQAILADAGATYWDPNTQNYKVADVLIDDAQYATAGKQVVPSIAQVVSTYQALLYGDESTFAFMRRNAVYRVDRIQSPTGAIAWFEKRSAYADVALASLINIIWQIQCGTEFNNAYFMRNVSANEGAITVDYTAESCPMTSLTTRNVSTVCPGTKSGCFWPSTARFEGQPGLSPGAIAGIVIAVLAVVGGVGFLVLRRMRGRVQLGEGSNGFIGRILRPAPKDYTAERGKFRGKFAHTDNVGNGGPPMAPSVLNGKPALTPVEGGFELESVQLET